MNYKSIISRALVFLPGLFCSAVYAKPKITPEFLAAAMTRTYISFAISSVIIVVLIYFLMKIARVRWGTVQALPVLFGSYVVGASLFMIFLSYLSPGCSFVFAPFSFVVLPLLLQAGSWFLLFKQHGWATVLLLCGISLLFPILFLSIGSLLLSFFGPTL